VKADAGESVARYRIVVHVAFPMSFVMNKSAVRRKLKDPLTVALALSLGLHLAAALTWKLGERLDWWKPGHLPKWVQVIQHLGTVAPEQKQASAKQAKQETLMTFIEVDPSLVAAPPEDAEHYGAVSTRAGNQKPVDTTKPRPKIDGREQPFEKTTENRPLTKETEEPSKAFPLQPDFKAAQSPDKVSEKQSKAGEQKVEEQGETLMAKAEPRPKKGATFGDPGEGLAAENQQRARPRTLAEAAARRGGVPGERTRTEGGVLNESPLAFNVKGTPFGAYDARFVDAVRESWYQAMGTQVTGGGGDVQVRFNLLSDGRITDLEVVRTTVDQLLTYYCRRAIEMPAPFEEWPPEMRREIGSNKREITFTFHYLQ
jgi:hypothetical protein